MHVFVHVYAWYLRKPKKTDTDALSYHMDVRNLTQVLWKSYLFSLLNIHSK